MIASDEEHVPQTVAARKVATPAEHSETAQPPVADEYPDASAADPAETQDERPTPAASREHEPEEPPLPDTAKAAEPAETPDPAGVSADAEEHRAQLIVHELSEDDEVVPHQEVEDQDTQPISWQAVRQNLERD